MSFLQEDGTVDHTGLTPAELRQEFLDRNGDITDIFDGDIIDFL